MRLASGLILGMVVLAAGCGDKGETEPATGPGSGEDGGAGDDGGSDDGGAWNLAPEIAITSHLSGDLAYADVAITLAGTVSDDSDAADALSVLWSSSVDGELSVAPADSAGILSFEADLSVGEHTLILEVTDSEGLSSLATVDLTVFATNTAPRCEITAPEPYLQASPGSTITFFGRVTDDEQPEGLEYSWSSDLDGELRTGSATSGEAFGFEIDSLAVGEHTILLSAVDEGGLSCESELPVTVSDPPTCAISAPNDGDSFSEGEEITFEGMVADDGDVTGLLVRWKSEAEGATLGRATPDSSGVVTLSWGDLAPGEDTITLWVANPYELTCIDTVTITVDAAP